MSFLIDRWRRIGARLYLALGFAVALTLVSGAVGVYYFEQSGDLNYQVGSESVPALEASWTAARETERLRILGFEVVAEAGSGFQGLDTGAVVRSLERLEAALDEVSSVPTLAADAQAVNDAAYDLAEVIDGLSVNQNELLSANDLAANYRLRLATTTSDIGESEAALSVLRQVLQSRMRMPFRNYGKSLPKYTRLASTPRSLLWEKARACSTSVADSLPWRTASGTWRRLSTS